MQAADGKNMFAGPQFAGLGPQRSRPVGSSASGLLLPKKMRPLGEICKIQSPVLASCFVTTFIVMSNVTFKANYAGIFIILCSAMALGYLRNFTDE